MSDDDEDREQDEMDAMLLAGTVFGGPSGFPRSRFTSPIDFAATAIEAKYLTDEGQEGKAMYQQFLKAKASEAREILATGLDLIWNYLDEEAEHLIEVAHKTLTENKLAARINQLRTWTDSHKKRILDRYTDQLHEEKYGRTDKMLRNTQLWQKVRTPDKFKLLDWKNTDKAMAELHKMYKRQPKGRRPKR